MIAGPCFFSGAGSEWQSDPYFSSVVLLLHGIGTNGATSFPDSSSHVHTLTSSGNVQISTVQSPFSDSSILFDGTTDYLDAGNSTDFDFGSNDFTFEVWIRHTGSKTNKAIAHNRNSGPTGGFDCYVNNNSTFRFDAYSAAGATFISITTPTVVLDTWVHCAVSRNNTLVKSFTNGVLRNTITVSAGAAIGSTASNLTIGKWPAVSSADYLGNLRDLRITKGVGRYSADFTPPIVQFPDS